MFRWVFVWLLVFVALMPPFQAVVWPVGVVWVVMTTPFWLLLERVFGHQVLAVGGTFWIEVALYFTVVILISMRRGLRVWWESGATLVSMALWAFLTFCSGRVTAPRGHLLPPFPFLG